MSVLSIGTRLGPNARYRTSRICWLKHPIRVLLLRANDLRFGANNLRFGAKMRRFVTAYEFLIAVKRSSSGRPAWLSRTDPAHGATWCRWCDDRLEHTFG
jgi:hypothetical protein